MEFDELLSLARKRDTAATQELVARFGPALQCKISRDFRRLHLQVMCEPVDVVQSSWCVFFTMLFSTAALIETAGHLRNLLDQIAHFEMLRVHDSECCEKRGSGLIGRLTDRDSDSLFAAALSTLDGMILDESRHAIIGSMTALELRIADRMADGASWGQAAVDLEESPSRIRKIFMRCLERARTSLH